MINVARPYSVKHQQQITIIQKRLLEKKYADLVVDGAVQVINLPESIHYHIIF
jgi:hypothetical protein